MRTSPGLDPSRKHGSSSPPERPPSPSPHNCALHIILADGGGTDGVFDKVVVDLQPAIFEEDEQRGPLIERVVDGFAHEAAGQEPALGFQPHQGPMQPRQHWSAETRPFGLTQLRAGSRLSQLVFEGVKVLEVFEEPARHFRRGVAGVVKFAPHMGQAAGEHDLAATAPGKAVVGFVTVALAGAAKVHGDDVVQKRRRTAGLPMENDLAARNTTDPEVTQLRPTVTRSEIAEGFYPPAHSYR